MTSAATDTSIDQPDSGLDRVVTRGSHLFLCLLIPGCVGFLSTGEGTSGEFFFASLVAVFGFIGILGLYSLMWRLFPNLYVEATCLAGGLSLGVLIAKVMHYQSEGVWYALEGLGRRSRGPLRVEEVLAGQSMFRVYMDVFLLLIPFTGTVMSLVWAELKGCHPMELRRWRLSPTRR